MGKTRLNNADRDVIAAAIIAHKFDAQVRELIEREAALALEAYNRLYSADTQAKMAALGDRAFYCDDDIRVAVNGQKYNLDFNVERRDYELGVPPPTETTQKILKPFLYRHYDGGPLVSVLDSDDFGARLSQFLQDREELKTARPYMRTQLDNTLASFRYFEDLLESFPEAEAFISKRWRERPEGGSPGVPAVVIKDLARQLDLPPPARAA